MIRPAQPNDAPAIVHVQVTTWHHAYKDLVPADFLATLSASPERIERSRQAILGGAWLYYVLEENGQIVSFAIGGKCRDEHLPQYDGELYTLYVLPDFQGKGYGTRLVKQIAHDLAHQHYRGMLIWVLTDNAPARRFYERLGGIAVATKTMTWGKELEETGYWWDDLSKFLPLE